MIACLNSGSLHGVDALGVKLEIDFTRRGMPAFTIVGLAEGAVREAKERVFTALRTSGFKLPPARITVNLAPADRRKVGTAFDLPLALGLLVASEQIPETAVADWFFAAELSLTGELKPVTGVLPLTMLARQEGARGIIVAPHNAAEAAIVDGLPSYAPQTLAQCVAFLCGSCPLETAVCPPQELPGIKSYPLDFADVKGQQQAKRALEIAAAGGHNILLMGPPGSGKSMLAKRMPSILPPLTPEEALDVTKIYSVAGKLPPQHGIMQERPFRAPHHTVSEVALVGGGTYPRPGEVSLAHCGVLFLDEFPEYRKSALEVLRQPLEDGVVTVSRAAQSITYPASCMLVAAMNPCPCGYHTDPNHTCTCTPTQIARYTSKLSGPLLDRIDLHIHVPAVPYEDLRALPGQGTSASIRQRVIAARDIQKKRYAGTSCHCNATADGALLEQHCALDAQGHTLMQQTMQRLGLSARSYTRILRLARTIADLAHADAITPAHLLEAVSLRSLDREIA